MFIRILFLGLNYCVELNIATPYRTSLSIQNLLYILFQPKGLLFHFFCSRKIIKTECFLYVRFIDYRQTTLEKNYKHDLLTEQDLGVKIDLINPETYEINNCKNIRLAEEDEKLLEDEVVAPQDTKRSRCHNRAITWLKKTEYISTEFNRYGASSDKTETKYENFKITNYNLEQQNYYLLFIELDSASKKRCEMKTFT